MNPYNYETGEDGHLVCPTCKKLTNKAYTDVPNLTCWNCGKRMGKHVSQHLMPDPAAIFGIAYSIYEAVKSCNMMDGVSEAYDGANGFMAECMRIGTEFENWCCNNVDFDQMADVWPYKMQDEFGDALVELVGWDNLESASAEHWHLVCVVLKIKIRE